jgi:hypothetical protein
MNCECEMKPANVTVDNVTLLFPANTTVAVTTETIRSGHCIRGGYLVDDAMIILPSQCPLEPGKHYSFIMWSRERKRPRMSFLLELDLFISFWGSAGRWCLI